jgi:hypothetical protein
MVQTYWDAPSTFEISILPSMDRLTVELKITSVLVFGRVNAGDEPFEILEWLLVGHPSIGVRFSSQKLDQALIVTLSKRLLDCWDSDDIVARCFSSIGLPVSLASNVWLPRCTFLVKSR